MPVSNVGCNDDAYFLLHSEKRELGLIDSLSSLMFSPPRVVMLCRNPQSAGFVAGELAHFRILLPFLTLLPSAIANAQRAETADSTPTAAVGATVSSLTAQRRCFLRSLSE